MEWVSILGISSGVVATIIGLVEIIKLFLKEKIDALVDSDKKKLDRVWIVVVAILAIGAAAAVVFSVGWNWGAFALAAPAYFVGAAGSYAVGKKVLPEKKE